MPQTRLDPLALPLHGSHLIEASAGTGKTFTIALLYVRLVLGHRQPGEGPLAGGLMPPNLLVVTFTDAATQELRDRIRARLTQAARVFDGDSADLMAGPETEALFRLRDQDYADPATWPECRRKLLMAAEWMDEAAVSTIHSWCHRMLSEHAFDSGSLFRLTLETDQSELLAEVVRDYWRTFIYPLDATAMEELQALWSEPDQLLAAVRYLLPVVDSLPQEPPPPAAVLNEILDLRQARAGELRSPPWRQWREEVVALLEDLNKAKRLHGASKNAMVKAWEPLLAWADSDQLVPQGLEKAGFQNQTPEGLAQKLKGEGPLPHHPAFDRIAELIDFAAHPPSARPDLLKHAACWIAQRLESEKQRRSEMGFDDLLTRLDAALHGPQGEQLAGTLRRQFPAALIDEFQDTDPVQYRIFDRVYRAAANDPHTCLLMIGDPKQAIYGFRGADIFTYLSARKATRERTHTLGTNFRSARAMVDAVNQVFEQADSRHPAGAFLLGQGSGERLPFQPVSAQGRDRHWWIEGESCPALTFWVYDTAETENASRSLAKGRTRDETAEVCAAEIARLLTLGQQGRAGFRGDGETLEPLAPRHIAILVNNRREAEAVRLALGQRQIKSVYLSDRDSVLATPEAETIRFWLQACAEPLQLDRIRAALATPLLGQSYAGLDQLLHEDRLLERAIERFSGYQQVWQRQGVLPMLRQLLMDYQVPARLLQQPDGERRLTDLLHIAELLQQASLQLDGEHALLHHYRQMLAEAGLEEEHRTLRLESDEDLVKVVTVHKSKGLEYPLVFLPFATAFRPVSDKLPFVTYHDADNQLQTVFDPTPESIDRADRERLGEDIRKLYVALTRARFATWVGAAAIDHWFRSGLGYLLAGDSDGEDLALQGLSLQGCLETLAGSHSAIRVLPLPEPGPQTYQRQDKLALGPARISQKAPPNDWWIASYSAIQYAGKGGYAGDVEDARQQNLLEAQAVETEPVRAEGLNPHGFFKGAGPGSFLHECLEWCAAQGFAKLVADSSPLYSSPLYQWLESRCLTRGWEDWVAVLHQWLLEVISAPIPLPEGMGAVSLAALDHPRAEMEFWFESRHVNTTALDRLVCAQHFPGIPRPAVVEDQFNGMLKGFIDLVFEHGGRYYVLDYKSNSLGPDEGAYTQAAMTGEILARRYDLQYLLYLLALHRLLQARLPDYDYDRHLGGAVYLFLRGCRAPGRGAFLQRPPRALIEAMDALFRGEREELPV